MSFVCKALRANLAAMKPEEFQVNITLALQERGGRTSVAVVEGGVTGYESYYVDAHMLHRLASEGTGWYLCAGTLGRWDSLRISPETCRELAAWIRAQNWLRQSEIRFPFAVMIERFEKEIKERYPDAKITCTEDEVIVEGVPEDVAHETMLKSFYARI